MDIIAKILNIRNWQKGRRQSPKLSSEEINVRALSAQVFKYDPTLAEILSHAHSLFFDEYGSILRIGFLPESTFFMNQVSRSREGLIQSAWHDLGGPTSRAVNVFAWWVLEDA